MCSSGRNWFMPANRTVRGNLCPLRRRCVGYTGEEIVVRAPTAE